MISKSLVLILLTLTLVASCSFNDFKTYPYTKNNTPTEAAPRTPASTETASNN